MFRKDRPGLGSLLFPVPYCASLWSNAALQKVTSNLSQWLQYSQNSKLQLLYAASSILHTCYTM